MSSEDMPLIVPCVPTGMKTGVNTSPCGNVTVDARARPQVASKLKTKGLRDYKGRLKAKLAMLKAARNHNHNESS